MNERVMSLGRGDDDRTSVRRPPALRRRRRSRARRVRERRAKAERPRARRRAQAAFARARSALQARAIASRREGSSRLAISSRELARRTAYRHRPSFGCSSSTTHSRASSRTPKRYVRRPMRSSTSRVASLARHRSRDTHHLHASYAATVVPLGRAAGRTSVSGAPWRSRSRERATAAAARDALGVRTMLGPAGRGTARPSRDAGAARGNVRRR